MKPPDAAHRSLMTALARDAPRLAEEIAQACEERIETYKRWRDRGEGERLRASVRVILEHFAGSTGRADLASELRDIGAHRAVQGLPLEAIPTSWLIITDHVWQWLAQEITPGSALDLGEVWSDFMRYVNDSAGAIQESYVRTSSEAYAGDVITAREDLDRLIECISPNQTAEELVRLGFTGGKYRVLLCCAIAGGQLLTGNRAAGFKQILSAVPALAGRRVLPWTVVNEVGVVLVPAEVNETLLQNAAPGADAGLGLLLSRLVRNAGLVGDSIRESIPLIRLTRKGRPFINAETLTLVEVASAKAAISFHELPDWLVRFEADDHAQEGRWRETLAALIDARMNIGEAAQRLYVHPNTVYYRLDAIRKSCGVDVRDPRIVADYLLAAGRNVEPRRANESSEGK